MHRTKQTCCLALWMSFFVAVPAAAETWSDVTGQFQLEAEYQGVSGSSVVLKKSDGSLVKVPIAKLSDESRARAKQLYDRQQNGEPSANPSPPVRQASLDVVGGSGTLKLSVSPPEPVSVQPMPPFPESASLQQTIDFVADQLLAGHPEVFWHMMPGEIRDGLDSDEVRQTAGQFIRQQAAAGEQSEQVMIQAMELLISKKEFVLNSQLMSQVPPGVLPIVKQAYDPVVGLVYELMKLSDGFENLQDRSIATIVDEHGPLIGGHLKTLISLTPRPMVDSIRGSIVATETGEATGSVASTDPGGRQQVVEFVRYDNRWIPKPVADFWTANKDDLGSKLNEGIEMANEQSAQSLMMAAVFVGMANSILQPLADATTQQEFDAALMQATEMAGSLQPGAIPGSAP